MPDSFHGALLCNLPPRRFGHNLPKRGERFLPDAMLSERLQEQPGNVDP